MAKKALKFFLIALIGLMLILTSLLAYGYFFGLKSLLENSKPSRQAYPELALDALWISLGVSGERTMQPLYPWHWLRAFSRESFQDSFPNSTNLSSFAARILIYRNKQRKRIQSWHISYMSATIWLSHHWTADQALNTILSETYFGNCKYGIEQAAQGYFGKPLAELKPKSIVMLVSLTKLPALYNPWKYPERSKEETMRIINLLKTKYGKEFNNGDVDLFSELLPKSTTECKM